MNIESLVSDFKVSYQSAVRAAGDGDRLPATVDVHIPVIWEQTDGSEVALTDICSYDSTVSACGTREYVGFNTDRGLRVQFIVENGVAHHDILRPLYV